jgi:hypothetical protein
MTTKPLKGSAANEHILQVEPPLQPSVQAGWKSRPNLYTGRAVSAEALSAEQLTHSGHLALRGQMTAPGIVSGLEVDLSSEMDPVEKRLIHRFNIAPGMGIAASGEDAWIPRALRVRLDRVPAYWQQHEEGPIDFDLSVLASVDPLVTHRGLLAAVLVLVPTVSKKDDPPDPFDPAEADPETHALEDRREVDGCALVLYAWPRHWPMPQQDPDWRNRLAWMIFDHERQLPHGQFAPWEQVGVPLALIGFQPPAVVNGPITPLFADCASVARPGGAPRPRLPLLGARGNPLLWQARSLQFSEHLTSFSAQQLQDGSALSAFAFLPPVGSLPKHAIDLFEWRHRFFPPPFILDAVPIPFEQLDAISLASGSLAPLDTSLDERVRILVPVPEAHFDPFLLQTELLDPSFPQAISSALLRLSEWLRRRKDLRSKATLLLNALEGRKTGRYPDPDPSEVPGEYTGVGPLDPATYGPEESAYGTEDGSIPMLEDALWQKGTWGTPSSLGFDTQQVSAARSPDGKQLAVLTRLRVRFGVSNLLSLRRFENGAWVPGREIITCPIQYTEFRMLWSGSTLVIVACSTSKITHGRYVNKEWEWEPPQTIPSAATCLTAVSWDDGCVDAFVAVDVSIMKFTWLQGVAQPSQTLSVSNRTIKSLDALHRGGKRIDLFFLGRPPADQTLYWLHHISGVHRGGASVLTEDSASEVKQLRGHHVSGCKSSATRLDVLVLRNIEGSTSTNKGIWHGWFEGTWRVGTELVGQTGGDAIAAVSRGDERVHAFWYEDMSSLSPPLPGPLTYRRLENNRWQPAEALRAQRLYLGRQSFTVVLNGTSPIDLFLASLDGLLHLKKVSDATQSTVEQKGLRGLISSVQSVQQRILDFIRDSTNRVNTEMQQIREGMSSSSTEASRYAVSATLGGTLVDSPLAVRSDAEGYLTRFIPRGRRDHIRLSDAMEALQDATTARHELTKSFLSLVKELGVDVTGMTLKGIARVDRPNGVRVAVLTSKTQGGPTKLIARDDYTVRSVLDNRLLLEDVLARLDEEPEAVGRALAATHSRVRWAESDYFSTSIKHLEHMLLLLRELERQARTFTLPVEAYRETLLRLEAFWAELDKRMKLVDGEVAEARQDVTVSRALMAEELQRLDGINQRRRRVFDQHVPFLVFQRPRTRDLTVEAPVRVLDTGIVEDILPEVFASTDAAPPELLAYVELVRDSPLKWFSFAPQLLRKLDRIEYIHRTFVRAQVRAVERVPIKLPFVAGRSSARFFTGMSRLVDAREELIARKRQVLVRFQPAVLERKSWVELQQSAHEQLSLDDLIDMSHGRADIGQTATLELERISKVATGLYQRFGEVLPVIRLEWAEQMSQYDADVDLRDLSRLPNWDQLDVTDRREFQTLVDWLFQRVVTNEPEAASLMSDLVRLCMLLASHAPVDELISGHLSQPSVAKAGGTLELAVDPSRVRVGMHVRINAGAQVVEAVVEDLASGVARAKVLTTSAPTVHLPEKSSARFIDPARQPGNRRLLANSELW